MGLLLVVCVVGAFAPCFSAGFLSYDDPWLIVDNPFFEPDAQGTLEAAFTDLSFDTRYALGAEYLPLRDTLVWLETRLFGKSAPWLHAVSVALYAVACLVFRSYLLRVLGAGLAAEAAALIFALHPVHVESVAWLAGQKDVLAMFFVALTLRAHTRNDHHARWLVPLWLACACLSKSMSVATITLLAATDVALQRKPDTLRYAASALVVVAALWVHLRVGSMVHMIAEPLGGSKLHALWTMGPVWFRYMGLCLFPFQLSIEHVVEPLTRVTPMVALSYGGLLLAFTLSVVAFVRGRPSSLTGFIWFFGPLAPVSQFIAPLQNRMADRYLWLSVMAPALLVAAGLSWLSQRSERGRTLSKWSLVVVCLALGAATFERSVTFSDSLLVFADGARKTEHGTRAPYQLALAFEEIGRFDEAALSYQEVLRRAPTGRVEDARRATNNLAKILAARGDMRQAEAVLRSGLTRFPDDPKMRGNLAKVLTGTGRDAEAAQYRPAAR